MPKSRIRLTPAIEQAIVAYIRAGGFPHVAAEAAGVPREDFERWLQLGRAPGARKRYRDFAAAIAQAVAQARLGAEVSIRNDKPLDWLRSGPGRESADCTGWTGTVKPRLAGPAGPLLLQPEVQTLLREVLETLQQFPEARAAIAPRLARFFADEPPTT